MGAFVDFVAAHKFFVAATALSAFWLFGTWGLAIWSHIRLSRHPFEILLADQEQRARFWEHALHEDRNISDRQYFFLVFQSVLLGIVGALYTGSYVDRGTLRVFAVL